MHMTPGRIRTFAIGAGLSAVVLAAALVAGQDRGAGGDALGHGYSRPARSPHGSRSEVIAPHGMVAASHPLAAQVGLDILKAGGNAIDAAVAVNAVLGLVEPHMNGVGGDLFAIVWDAETERLHGLNATGRAPYEINPGVFARQNLERVPGNGPLTWTVPGAVDGWDQLLTRFGTMSFADVLAPAIAYARDGFPVSEIIQRQWAASEASLARWPTSAATYLPNGRPPAVGEVFRNPGLVRTYEAIAQGGRDTFYRGEIARKIVAFSESNGGYFTMRDFEDHSSVWVEPVTSSYRGYDIWEIPPNSSGIVALMMLNILEGYDLAGMGHNSAAAIHRIVEAKKLAFADRNRYVADADANRLPIDALISKEYAERRRALIDPTRASRSVSAGDPTETVYLTVVDRDRNAISLIESIFGGFGSKVVPADLGFALQNRGSGFSLQPGHFNEIAPAQAVAAHQHAGLRHQGRQAVPVVRRDGGRHATAGTHPGAVEHHRLWDEPAGGGRCRPRAPRRRRHGRAWNHRRRDCRAAADGTPGAPRRRRRDGRLSGDHDQPRDRHAARRHRSPQGWGRRRLLTACATDCRS